MIDQATRERITRAVASWAQCVLDQGSVPVAILALDTLRPGSAPTLWHDESVLTAAEAESLVHCMAEGYATGTARTHYYGPAEAGGRK